MAEAKKTTKKNNEEKELHLQWEARPFRPFGKTTRINSKQLSIDIKEQFQQTFHELAGCLVTFSRNFEVTLFFEKNVEACPEGKITSLVDFTNPQGLNRSNLMDGMRYLNNKTSGKTFELNSETKALLSDFMFGGRNANRDWKQLVSERRMPTDPYNMNPNMPRGERILIAVTGFDIRRIIEAMYGSVMVTDTYEEDGQIINVTAKAMYEVKYAKPKNDGTFMINIEQFDVKKVEELTREENPVINNGYGFMMY